MIRNITLAVSVLGLTLAVVPSTGCSSSGDSSGGAASTAGSPGSAGMSTSTAGSAGAAAQPSAGSSSVAGAGGSNGSAGSSGSSTSAGSSGAGAGNGGAPGSSGSGSGGKGGGGSAGAPSSAGCDAANLVFKTANKTNYTSFPEPGSDECVKYSGCLYEGMFAACDKTQTLDWVKTHNIVAAFPLKGLELHDLCLKKGNKTIVVTVYDTCGDSDCDGCCTENKGNKDELIDVESFTDQRWGVDDGEIQWADLGPTKTTGCAK